MEQAYKKVTLEALVKQSKTLKEKKPSVREVYIHSLDGTVTVEEPSYELCLDAITGATGDSADVHLIYNCVISPNLKDKELQTAYNCSEPDDIVRKVFKPGEITALSKALVGLAGYVNSVQVLDDLKNA